MDFSGFDLYEAETRGTVMGTIAGISPRYCAQLRGLTLPFVSLADVASGAAWLLACLFHFKKWFLELPVDGKVLEEKK